LTSILPGDDISRASTITVGTPALKAHLAHGDHEGSCKDDRDKKDDGKKNKKESDDKSKKENIKEEKTKKNKK